MPYFSSFVVSPILYGTCWVNAMMVVKGQILARKGKKTVLRKNVSYVRVSWTFHKILSSARIGQRVLVVGAKVDEHYKMNTPYEKDDQALHSLETKWDVIKYIVVKFIGVASSV